MREGGAGRRSDAGYDRESLLRSLCRTEPSGVFDPPNLHTLRQGEAAGPLLGGTLTQLLASLGTPFAFTPPNGYILFLDEIGERPYRLDRMVTQLGQSGLLARAAAVVIGDTAPHRSDGEAEVAATFEMLETLGVPVWCFRSDELPAFYCSSGLKAEQSFFEPEGVARAVRMHWDALESATGVVVAVQPPIALARTEIEAALEPALRQAAARKLPGKEITPFLLAALSKATSGRAQEANLALLENNASTAADIARAL